MIVNTEAYCEWVSYLSEILFHLLNLGLFIGASYGFWQARKTKEILFPVMLSALLALRLISEYVLLINDVLLNFLSFAAISLGMAWVNFHRFASHKQKVIGGVLLIIATFIALNSLSNIEYYRLYLWFGIVFNVIFWYPVWWKRYAAIAIGSVWLLVPATAPDPSLCIYFNAMWASFSLVCIACLIALKK